MYRKFFLPLPLIVAAMAGCVDDEEVNRPHNTPVTYGGQISVAQGVNPVGTTGPIIDKVGIVISIANTGSQPMRVDDVMGRALSNDSSLMVDFWIEMETNTGKVNVGRALSTPVDIRTVISLNNVVVNPNETVILRIFMTSQAASTGDVLQFQLHEVNSTGGTAGPWGTPPQPLSGQSYLAG